VVICSYLEPLVVLMTFPDSSVRPHVERAVHIMPLKLLDFLFLLMH